MVELEQSDNERMMRNCSSRDWASSYSRDSPKLCRASQYAKVCTFSLISRHRHGQHTLLGKESGDQDESWCWCLFVAPCWAAVVSRKAVENDFEI